MLRSLEHKSYQLDNFFNTPQEDFPTLSDPVVQPFPLESFLLPPEQLEQAVSGLEDEATVTSSVELQQYLVFVYDSGVRGTFNIRGWWYLYGYRHAPVTALLKPTCCNPSSWISLRYTNQIENPAQSISSGSRDGSRLRYFPINSLQIRHPLNGAVDGNWSLRLWRWLIYLPLVRSC
jgi:hypothetical protein